MLNESKRKVPLSTKKMINISTVREKERKRKSDSSTWLAKRKNHARHKANAD